LQKREGFDGIHRKNKTRRKKEECLIISKAIPTTGEGGKRGKLLQVKQEGRVDFGGRGNGYRSQLRRALTFDIRKMGRTLYKRRLCERGNIAARKNGEKRY